MRVPVHTLHYSDAEQHVAQRIRQLNDVGKSIDEIVVTLNTEGLVPCRGGSFSHQIVNKLKKRYGIVSNLERLRRDGGLSFAYTINDMAKMLTGDFIREQGATFPIGYGPRDSAYGYLQHPTMLQLYMPTIVMIDRKGQITAQYTGGDLIFGKDLAEREKNFRKLIEESLKKPGGAGRKVIGAEDRRGWT